MHTHDVEKGWCSCGQYVNKRTLVPAPRKKKRVFEGEEVSSPNSVSVSIDPEATAGLLSAEIIWELLAKDGAKVWTSLKDDEKKGFVEFVKEQRTRAYNNNFIAWVYFGDILTRYEETGIPVRGEQE